MEDQLRRLQLTQLEILKVFDRFCRKHQLRYSLYAGSLLGAVRHQGFIPWDDDLDVCMARDDYDRFLFLWDTDPCEGYVLQNKENSVSFDQSFTKLRKDHTTFLQDRREIGGHHTGIFLDIFPIDRIPDVGWRRTLYRWNCMRYQLLTREFVPPKGSAAVRAGSAVLLAVTPKKLRGRIRKRLLKRLTAYNGNTGLETAATETMASLSKPFSPTMLDAYVDLPFEDGAYMCFAGWDDHLRRKFGDYMQLPPESERAWKHHLLVIDFEHNYGEEENSGV